MHANSYAIARDSLLLDIDVLSCSLVVCLCCVPVLFWVYVMSDFDWERSAASDPARDEFPAQISTLTQSLHHKHVKFGRAQLNFGFDATSCARPPIRAGGCGDAPSVLHLILLLLASLKQ